MARDNLILTLGKVIVAAAWADGEISHDEVNSLKDLLFHLPDMTGREWASLEMYIDSPIGEAERVRLVQQLIDQLRSSSDRELAIRALDDVIQADGVITDEEEQVIDDIKAQLENASVGLLGALGRAVAGSIARREEALRNAPNREEHFEDFIKNKVFYGLQRRLKDSEKGLDIPEADLRKLCLAGGLMARVAHVDQDVSQEEFDSITEAIAEGWDVKRKEATFIAEVALSEIGPDMDYYRLSRGFFTMTSEEERTKFLGILFKVAAAHEGASAEEIHEIRAIANSLRLTHKQFIDAKLTIPKDQRAN
jgi:uncharacterized tellurite resistance protein B-like protein